MSPGCTVANNFICLYIWKGGGGGDTNSFPGFLTVLVWNWLWGLHERYSSRECYSCKGFFFFFSPPRESHCGIGPRCRPSGNTAKWFNRKGNSYSNWMVPYSFPRIIIKFMSPAKELYWVSQIYSFCFHCH